MNENYLDYTSLILQLLSLEILFKDCNNNDLMKELQNQDIKYLDKILENQNIIIKLLKDRGE